MSEPVFFEQFTKQYAWSQAPAKRIFRNRKEINHGMAEEHRLSLTLHGVINRAIDDDDGLQSSDYSTYQIFEANDLVFKLIDLENIKTSRVGYVPRRGIMSPVYIRLEPSKIKVFSKYYYWLFYAIYLNNIFNGMGGGVRQNLTSTDLLNFPVPLPDISTQREIADFLDEETFRIDLLIEKKEQLLSVLIEKYLAPFDAHFKTGSQTRFERVVSQASRTIDETRYDTVVPIGLFNRGRGIFLKEKTNATELGDSDFYFIKDGDLIFSGQFAWEGAVALVSKDEDGCVASHRYPVFTPVRGINNAYLFAFFRTKYGQFILNDCSRGAAGRNRPLNVNRLNKWKIPIPSDGEQNKVAELVHKEQVLKKLTKQSISKIEEYRAALITFAVTGQIDVKSYGKSGTVDYHLDKLQKEDQT